MTGWAAGSTCGRTGQGPGSLGRVASRHQYVFPVAVPGTHVHRGPRPSSASSSFKSFLNCKAELGRLNGNPGPGCEASTRLSVSCLTRSSLRSLALPKFYHLLERQSFCMVI